VEGGMKCKKNKSIITTKSCIKRQELAKNPPKKYFDEEQEENIKSIKKCLNCKRGRIVKRFPRKRFDNDIKIILREQIVNFAKQGILSLSMEEGCTEVDLLVLIEMGVIQEINREILHVLGLNLIVEGDRLKIKQTKKLGGYIIKSINLKKKQNFNNLFAIHSRIRKEKTGFIIQPL
jgi:hypothetical protein